MIGTPPDDGLSSTYAVFVFLIVNCLNKSYWMICLAIHSQDTCDFDWKENPWPALEIKNKIKIKIVPIKIQSNCLSSRDVFFHTLVYTAESLHRSHWLLFTLAGLQPRIVKKCCHEVSRCASTIVPWLWLSAFSFELGLWAEESANVPHLKRSDAQF